MLFVAFAGVSQVERARVNRRLSELDPGAMLATWGQNMVASVANEPRWQSAAGFALMGQVKIPDRRTSRALSLDELGPRLVRDGALALQDMAGPFRIAWQASECDEICIAADHAGIAHIYGWQGEGVACVSSSAILIGRLFGLRPDLEAMAGLGLIGSMVGQDSAVSNVRKLLFGCLFTLADGVLRERELPAASSLIGDHSDAQAISAAVMRQSDAFPDAHIEVSAGFDSRLILASMPVEVRRRHRAITIGAPDNIDVVIARKICAMNGMAHDVVDPGLLRELDAKAFETLLKVSATDCEFSSNPLDRVTINFINQRFPASSRFSGQNGEYLRGIYYPGQSLRTPIDRTVAQRVLSWRFMTNDLADPIMFDPKWYGDQKAKVVGRLTDTMVGYGGTSGEALDRFFLEQRMQRWCGAAVSSALAQRQILLPFFEADVLAVGARTPPWRKDNSRFFAGLIVQLDDPLGHLVMEVGLTPRVVAAGGIGARVEGVRQTANKLMNKIGRKLFARNQATLGSINVVDHYYEHRLFEKFPLAAVAGFGVFNAAVLERFVAGTWRPTRGGLGLLINVGYLATALD